MINRLLYFEIKNLRRSRNFFLAEFLKYHVIAIELREWLCNLYHS